MSNPNKQTDVNRLPKQTVKKALAGLAVGAVLYPVVAPNAERVWTSGKQPSTAHESPVQALGSEQKLGDGQHKVSFNLGPNGRVWDIAEEVAKTSGQDIREASDNIETYLPDQKDHFTQPDEVITVIENSHNQVVPNPDI